MELRAVGIAVFGAELRVQVVEQLIERPEVIALVVLVYGLLVGLHVDLALGRAEDRGDEWVGSFHVVFIMAMPGCRGICPVNLGKIGRKPRSRAKNLIFFDRKRAVGFHGHLGLVVDIRRFARAALGLLTVLGEADDEGLSLIHIFPLEGQSTTSPGTRFERGLAVQKAIFGAGHIDALREAAPEGQKHIQDYLSMNCFGDYVTRGGLDARTRELLTFSMLLTLGGCEPQLKGHIRGNLNLRNDKRTLLRCV